MVESKVEKRNEKCEVEAKKNKKHQQKKKCINGEAEGEGRFYLGANVRKE